MKPSVLVLFPDEWDRAAARASRHAGRFAFAAEGFDLFRFPQNARLFTFDALDFARRVARRHAGRGVEAVVTSDEQFGPFLAPLVAERLGVPHASLDAVLTVQHKYYARQAFARLVPEHNPRFGLLRRHYDREARLPLEFPFYVKPVKAAYSVLARRVLDREELLRHTTFGWLERRIIERLVKPFGDVMRERLGRVEEPFSMIAEEILPGRQVTANGFARGGRVTMLGTVDSVMYPGTDHFQRFQYPSTLPTEVLARVDAIAARLIEGIGLADGMFNVEMRVDTASGRIGVIEINPRAAGQFYDLFERVDGYSLFDAAVELARGEAPAIRRREGPDAHAASFVLRDLAGEGLARWPRRGEIAALRAANPDARLMFYPKRGADLRRELKWLGSYRYATFNLGAGSVEALFRRFHAIHAQVGFHPRGQRAPGVEALLEHAAGDD